MIKAVRNGAYLFVGLLVTNALMKLLGEPLLALIPSGTWTLDTLSDLLMIVGRPAAAFWFALAVVVLGVWWLVANGWVHGLGAVLLVPLAAGGAVVGVVHRFNTGIEIANALTDPAMWWLLAGLLAPGVLWMIKGLVENAVWSYRHRKVGKHRARWTVSHSIRGLLGRNRSITSGADA